LSERVERHVDVPIAHGYARRVTSRLSTRNASMLLALGVMLGMSLGCPREIVAPPPPGAPCTTTEDCNAGLTCGELSACVGNRCEEGRSIRLPCR